MIPIHNYKMKNITQAISEIYHKYDYSGNKQPLNLFVLKIVALKFMTHNHYIEWNTQQQKSIKKAFTINRLMRIWNHNQKTEIWYEEESNELNEAIWKDVTHFLDEPFEINKPILLAEVYEQCIQAQDKKNGGVFYTPQSIARYLSVLATKTFEKDQKILDPACGSGSLLSAVYDHLYQQNPSVAMHQYLLTRVLYGMDTDPVAAVVTQMVLAFKNAEYCFPKNIKQGDTLLQTVFKPHFFDVILANPPYIGHKEIGKAYRKSLQETYGHIYKNKGDLSYCFFQLGETLLKEKGCLVFITSRYFIEALHAKALREFIQQNFQISQLIDFNGLRIIDGVGVDLAIIKLIKSRNLTGPIKVNKFIISKEKKRETSCYCQDLLNNEQQYYVQYEVEQKTLNPEIWHFYSTDVKALINKIEGRAQLSLESIVNSFQGIITGYDRAFVFNETEPIKALPSTLMHPWIKSKDIGFYKISKFSKQILYTNVLKDLSQYPEVETYLQPFKARLQSRRECLTGKTPWFYAQWGRKKALFEQNKIVFPYKAQKNRFAIDIHHTFFSADIYGMILKNTLYAHYSEKALIVVLNSALYNWYYHQFAKKLGRDLFEYYPNTLMKLKIPEINLKEKAVLEQFYDAIVEGKIQHEDINPWIYEKFAFTAEEIKVVESE